MNFLYPEHLLYLWGLPAVLLVGFLGYRRYRKRLERLVAIKMRPSLLTHEPKPTLYGLKAILMTVGCLFVIIALARPRLGFEWQEVRKGGLDIMIALDLSRSMLADDIKPSRLERAKREIVDLIDMMDGDRIGLTVFAGTAFVQCPLTIDYRLASIFVNSLSLDFMPVQGTALAQALDVASDALQQYSKLDNEGKAILLITDGEDHGAQVMAAAKRAKDKGIRIFAIGIGAIEGAPIPNPEGGFQKDASGQVILSKLDEQTLKDIAIETGGTYARSTTGDLDLDTVYTQGIKRMNGEGQFAGKRKTWHEHFQVFLALGLVLLFFSYVTRPYRIMRPGSSNQWRRAAATSLVLLGLVAVEKSQGGVRSARKQFEDGHYDKAAEQFQKHHIENPDELRSAYNGAVANFKDRKFEDAERGFAAATEAQEPELAGKAWYNLGNTKVAQGKLEEAVAAYQQALEKVPEDTQAKENLEWAKKYIEKQKQQQQQGQDDDRQQNDKDDGDQQQAQQNNQGQDKQQKQNSDQQSDQSDQDQPSSSNEMAEDAKKQQGQPQQAGGQEAEDNKTASAQAQQPMEAQELSKEQALQLLRSLEADQDNTKPAYGIPGKKRANRPPSNKDW